MKYIVTGASSFLGEAIVNQLCRECGGGGITAMLRAKSANRNNIPAGVNVVYANMDEYGDLSSKITTPHDVFINLAWAGTTHGGRDLETIQKENVQNTLDAIREAAKIGCKLFVESGSQAEYGTVTTIISEDTYCNPQTEYGKAKLNTYKEGRELAESLGMRYVHLRIFSLFGEHDHERSMIMQAIRKMINDEELNLSNCTQKWNYMYASDAAKMIVELCVQYLKNVQLKSDVYNIASNDTRVLKEFVERIKILTKSNSQINYGAYQTPVLVSLNPDIEKIQQIVNVSFTPFDDVVQKIISTIQNE